MTSTADSARSRRRPGRLQTVLLIAMLVVFALQTPMPWGGLWLIVPGAVALSLLTAWRFGGWGVLVPLGLFGISLAVVGNDRMWAWWIPFAALTGAWMGIREEGGGPSAGDRAWMLLPLLLLAATIPWTAPYEGFVQKVQGLLSRGDDQMVAFYQQLGYTGERLVALERTMAVGIQRRDEALPFIVPTLLFLWMVMLVAAGRSFSSRAASAMKWPAVSRANRRTWRMPDGTLWVLLAGLALVIAPWPDWAPTAWTLIINSALAYCVQGIAVVESLLLARGLPQSLIALTMIFFFTLAMPMFMIITAALGISDVWLDYRRLESPSDADVPGA